MHVHVHVLCAWTCTWQHGEDWQARLSRPFMLSSGHGQGNEHGRLRMLHAAGHLSIIDRSRLNAATVRTASIDSSAVALATRCVESESAVVA